MPPSTTSAGELLPALWSVRGPGGERGMAPLLECSASAAAKRKRSILKPSAALISAS
jgi:hypothetical protein